MAITPKQEKFAQCVADGMSQAEAYRTAFDVSPGSKPETSQANASRLMADSRISARVYELRNKLSEKALWTREDSVRALKEIAGRLSGDEKVSDAVTAIKELNAMHGFNAPAKVELSGELSTQNITRIELVPLDGNS